MKRRVFTDLEIGGALRDLESGVRLPEVCARIGVSERTVNRWRREARAPRPATAPLGLVPLSTDQAAIRSEALERHLDALRLVLHTLLEPEELDRGARLVEARCGVSAQRARRMLGLAPVNARGAAPFPSPTDVVARELSGRA
jgi:transposase-like protein